MLAPKAKATSSAGHQARVRPGGNRGESLPSRGGANVLTVEVEDEEAPVGEVAVELEQDLVGGAVRGFQRRVSAEDSELR